VCQGLVVTPAVASCGLELGRGQPEPIRGSPPPYPPAALDDLELWAMAGRPIAPRMSARCQRLRDASAPMPGARSIPSTTRGHGAAG
jgi:hypothetical protein